MDRFAVFVDAGYLIGGGGLLCLGSRKRDQFDVDYAGLAAALERYGTEQTGLPHLRTYWYDAATNATPAPWHITVARLSGVKLRLGRLTEYGQKGVDSLLVRDLITLATNRALATGILISGDEDLREGVREAQELGVRMHVVGVEQSGIADALGQEADVVDHLHRELLAPYFIARSTQVDARAVGRAFGEDWLARAAPERRREVAALAPRIPAEVDSELIRYGARLVAPVLSDQQREDLRAGFWEAVGGVVAGEDEHRALGRSFAREWLAAATDGQRIAVKASFPDLPPDIDDELVRRAELSAGATPDPRQRDELRGGFWDVLTGVS